MVAQSPNPVSGSDASAGRVTLAGYVPLETRTLVASTGVVVVTVCSFLLDAVQLAVGGELDMPSPPVFATVVVFASAAALTVSFLSTAIAYLMWIYQAAVNLRALGRTGMHYSPGWCVGWFFVPFANLMKPSAAVNELWRASAPTAGAGRAWQKQRISPLVRAWWMPWILGSVLGNASGRIHDAWIAGMVGLVGSSVLALAAYGCIVVMRDVARRQEQAAAATFG